jgi:hypothetical protein
MIKKMKATRRGQFLAKMREHLIGMKIQTGPGNQL